MIASLSVAFVLATATFWGYGVDAGVCRPGTRTSFSSASIISTSLSSTIYASSSIIDLVSLSASTTPAHESIKTERSTLLSFTI